jgi:hypothetical protein
MKKCKSCGTDNELSAAVCSKCLKDLPYLDDKEMARLTKWDNIGAQLARDDRDKPSSTSKLLMLGGVLLGAYAYFVYDVSNGGFVNIGLMDNRRNMLMVAAVMVIVGAILNRKKSV